MIEHADSTDSFYSANANDLKESARSYFSNYSINDSQSSSHDVSPELSPRKNMFPVINESKHLDSDHEQHECHEHESHRKSKHHHTKHSSHHHTRKSQHNKHNNDSNGNSHSNSENVTQESATSDEQTKTIHENSINHQPIETDHSQADILPLENLKTPMKIDLLSKFQFNTHKTLNLEQLADHTITRHTQHIQHTTNIDENNHNNVFVSKSPSKSLSVKFFNNGKEVA